MKAYKGFRPDMTCRGFQYKEGETYTTDRAKVCDCGFHACEHPLDCFGYYEPGEGSVYHEVEMDGHIDKRPDGDTKIAATKITIGARLSIAGLVKAAIDYTMARIKPEAKADEAHGAASATGDRGAASATGDRGAASATGYSGAASAENETAVAVGWGILAKAKGVKGAHIVLADWRETATSWKLHGAKLLRIDGKKYKADTWYRMENGKVVEVKED